MRAGAGVPRDLLARSTDPLFATLAARFLALYTQTYGAGTYYLADSFNEMTPPIEADGADARNAAFDDATGKTVVAAGKSAPDPALKARRLAAYGQAIHEAFQRARPRRGLGDAGLAVRRRPGVLDLGRHRRLPEPRARRQADGPRHRQ